MVDLVFLGVNDVGKRIYDWLTDREEVAVLALVTEKDQLSLVERLEPDLLVSAGFRHIVPEAVLDVPELGAVNLHKSYLPYNRGANPNVWSIVENNPAGVSIHYMTPEVDAGPVVDRRSVPVRPDDTGRSLYERLEDEQVKQFVDVWPQIQDGTAETIEQSGDDGTEHYKREFVDLWELDLEEEVRTKDLLNRLRALTFPPYRNAYFEIDGTRYHVEVSITRAEAANTDEKTNEKSIPEYSEEEYR